MIPLVHVVSTRHDKNTLSFIIRVKLNEKSIPHVFIGVQHSNSGFRENKF